MSGRIKEGGLRASLMAGEYRTGAMALMLFALLMLQRTIFGFRYFPMIDDWFLYYGKSVAEDALSLIDLSVRPFAGIADILIYTNLTGCMILAQVLLMAMLAAAMYFLHKAFEGGRISAGAMLMAVTALSPIGFEGLYWISAASRIIASLFFASLAVYAEVRYLKAGGWRNIVMFAVASLFAVGFYEMMIPIFLVLTVMVMLKYRKSLWIMVFPIVFTIAAMVYYKVASSDAMVAERAQIVTSDLLSYHIWDTYDWYKRVLVDIYPRLLYHSFKDGIDAMAVHPVRSVLITAAAAGFALLAKGGKNGGSLVYDIVFGIAAMAAAVALTLVLSYVRLPFRVVYPMFIGGAIIAEAVLCRILPKWVYKAAVFALVFMFSVCNIGELALYKSNSEQDEACCAEVIEKTNAEDNEKVTMIFNAPVYWYDDRVQHYEYVKAVTENYAAMTGMVRYYTGIFDINNVMTVHDGDLIGVYDYENPTSEMFYMDENGNLKPCTAVRLGDNFNIMGSRGEFIGSLTLTDGAMRYDINPDMQ